MTAKHSTLHGKPALFQFAEPHLIRHLSVMIPVSHVGSVERTLAVNPAI